MSDLSMLDLTPETATLYAAVIAVVGSALGGWIGARATWRAMRESIRVAETTRTQAQEQERRSALRALEREFHMNLSIADNPRVSRALVPFERAALDSAQPHLVTLNDDVHSAYELTFTRVLVELAHAGLVWGRPG